MNKKIETEVVIVGAGLVGLTAAIAFAQQNRKVVLLDSKSPDKTVKDEWDQRIYALTVSSVEWLKCLKIWDKVDGLRVNSIDAMQLWAEGAVQPLCLDAGDAHLEQMGCIVESQNLIQACWQVLDDLDVSVMSNLTCQSVMHSNQQVSLFLSDGSEVVAKLLLGADGSNSWIRQHVQLGEHLKAFDQIAIVANYQAEYHHRNIARQWFGVHETLALLPLPQKNVSMVWSLPSQEALELLKLSIEDLAGCVETRSKFNLGELKPLNNAVPFMLNQKTASHFISERVALVGDAAHQVHPMAGQGVNLGFGDVRKLIEITTNLNQLQDIGNYSLLRAYERARKLDVFEMNQLIAGLDVLFSDNTIFIPKLTMWGMQLINSQTSIKQKLIKHATL